MSNMAIISGLTTVYFEPSLALVAFAFLMWITVPWAFLDDAKHPRARLFLSTAQKLFFAAGVFFIGELMSELLAPYSALVSNDPSWLQFLFFGGVLGTAFGVLFTYALIDQLIFGKVGLQSLQEIMIVLFIIFFDSIYLYQIIYNRFIAFSSGWFIGLFYVWTVAAIPLSLGTLMSIREHPQRGIFLLILMTVPVLLLVAIRQGVH